VEPLVRAKAFFSHDAAPFRAALFLRPAVVRGCGTHGVGLPASRSDRVPLRAEPCSHGTDLSQFSLDPAPII
jgi:hypothetical protein